MTSCSRSPVIKKNSNHNLSSSSQAANSVSSSSSSLRNWIGYPDSVARGTDLDAEILAVQKLSKYVSRARLPVARAECGGPLPQPRGYWNHPKCPMREPQVSICKHQSRRETKPQPVGALP